MRCGVYAGAGRLLVSRNRPLGKAPPDRGALEAAAARCARAHPCVGTRGAGGSVGREECRGVGISFWGVIFFPSFGGSPEYRVTKAAVPSDKSRTKRRNIATVFLVDVPK